MGYWLAAAPILVEFLWLASYVPRWRRWREARRDIERTQGLRLHPVEHLDAVYMTLAYRLAGTGRVRLADGDLRWAGWYLLYHFPLLLPLRLTVGTANPLMGFDARVAVTTVGTAAVYTALWLSVW